MPILVYDNDGEEATIIPGLDVGNAYTPWFISILTHNIVDEELVNTRSIIGENIMDKKAKDKVKVYVDSRQPENIRSSRIFWVDIVIGVLFIGAGIVVFVLGKK